MRCLSLLLLAAAPLAAAGQAKDRFGPIEVPPLDRTDPVIYQKEIEPILEDKCMYCHSGSLTEGKLDMGDYKALMKGGKSGPAIVPGKSGESLLFHLSARTKKPIMPPKSEIPLEPQELALIKLWIDQGAKPPTGAREKPKIVVGLPPSIVNPVRAVAVTADGTLVAASRGNEIHLYDAKTGEHKKELVDPSLLTPDKKPAGVAHMALVDSLAFAPDGKTLASGSFQEVKLWDVDGASLKQTVGGFADRVVSIDYAPDGKLFATGGGAPTEDGEIKLFDAAGKQVGEIAGGHSDTVFGVRFSPDGKVLATGGADKFVKTWEVPSGKPLKSFEGHTHHVLDVGWNADGKKLASAGADNVVKVWDYEKGEQARTINAAGSQVTRLAFVGKTTNFLTAAGDKQLRMWNVDNGGNVRNFGGNNDYLYAVAVDEKGDVIAAGGEEGVVRLYNGKNGQVIKEMTPPEPGEAAEKKEEPKK